MKVPPGFRARGIVAAMALMAWASSSAADGINEDEWSNLVTDVVGPQIRDVVVERATRLRIAREKRGTVGRSKFETWTQPLVTVADGIRFRDWATSALADNKIDEGEVIDLVIQHIAPYVIQEIADAVTKADDDQDDA